MADVVPVAKQRSSSSSRLSTTAKTGTGPEVGVVLSSCCPGDTFLPHAKLKSMKPKEARL